MRHEANFPIDHLVPAPWNPRGAIDDASLADLVGNVAVHGVLSPILVRRLDDTRAEIIAGHRRHRAAQLAGLTAVPVNVADATDEEARTLAITENLQRTDLHPLDEAKGFAELASRGVPIGKVAAQVGKSAAYVAGRMALANLTAQPAAFFRAGVIQLGHALVIATMQPRDQDAAAKHLVPRCGDNFEVVTERMREAVPSVEQLRAWKRHNVLHDLKRAIWPINTFRTEGGVACTGCPMRGGLNLGLFEADDEDDDADDAGYCHNGACFAEKQTAWLDEIGARAAEDAGLGLVRVATGSAKAPKGVLKPAAYTELKSTAKALLCEDSRMAVVVAVDRYGSYGPARAKLGDTFPVCTAKECARHGRTVAPKKPKGSAVGGDESDHVSARQRLEAAQKARAAAKDALRLRLVAAASWPLPDALIAQLLSDLAEQCGDDIGTLPTCDPETALARLLVSYLVEGERGGWEGSGAEAFQAVCAALDVPFDPACEVADAAGERGAA